MTMKTVVINRGVVGSGKSSLSAEVSAMAEHNNLTCNIRNTDEYFMIDGEYKFDPSKLGVNHKANFDAFVDSLASGVNVVIADNTNLRAREYNKYVEVAKQYGYNVVAVVFIPDSVAVHLKRNTHNVPEETVERFIDTLIDNLDTVGVDLDIPFHPNSRIGRSFDDRITTLTEMILDAF